MNERTIKNEYFYGNKISDYGIKNGYVDYATLAEAFDAVLNNSIWATGWELGEWEQVNGIIDNSAEIEELSEQLEALEENDENPEEQEEIADKIRELEEEQENGGEIFQWFIISEAGAHILEEWTEEAVFYNEKLDMYLWGVSHFGTSWDYVLTDISIEQ